MEILSIICYLVLAAGVVFFSVKLSDYIDLLDKKTSISGAFLGGILLAAVTSLPELFTSLTAVVILPTPNNHYVLGNILGSNAFNLILFFFVFAIFFKKLVNAKVGKAHLITIALTAVMYVVTTVASIVFNGFGLLWGWFNPMSLVIAAVYVFSILKTPKTEEAEVDENEVESPLTVKQIVIRFIIFALLLISASITITYVVDWISSLFNLGATFGGALFLGVATSLPEATATFNLCRKKNFNAAYGNILGSGVFNFFILALADALSFRCGTGIFAMDQSALFLICSAILSMIIVVVLTIIQMKGLVKQNIIWRIVYFAGALLIIGGYFTALVLSNINLGIAWAPIVA